MVAGRLSIGDYKRPLRKAGAYSPIDKRPATVGSGSRDYHLSIDVYLHPFLMVFDKLLHCLLATLFSIAIRKRESLSNMSVYLLWFDIHTINDCFITAM